VCGECGGAPKGTEAGCAIMMMTVAAMSRTKLSGITLKEFGLA
jgi:hypothetical protein